ncbi:hypothetical protein ACFS4T_14040 [Pseudomonas lini]
MVDTLPDITWCLNQVLLEHGCPAQTAQIVRGYIGGGVTAMIKQIATRFGIADAVALHQRYVALYQNNLVQFFPAIQRCACLARRLSPVARAAGNRDQQD